MRPKLSGSAALLMLLNIALYWPPFPLQAGETEASMSSRALPLSGSDWRLHEDPDGNGVDRRLFDTKTSSPDWIAASVPGNIQADLEAAHKLTPLWYGLGDARLPQVACKDWWYRKDFVVPGSFVGKRLTLVFDGVDHECEVFLNGVRVGRNAGMYKRFWFDVSRPIRPGRVNRLAVRIARMPEELRGPMLEADAAGGVNVGKATDAVRKCLKELKSPTNSGYDWAVAIYTLGIWKDVCLEATGPVRLDWVGVKSTLTNNYSKAAVEVELDLDSLRSIPVNLVLSTAHGEAHAQATVRANVVIGTNHLKATLLLNQPALWWPTGQGQQPLYDLVVELRNSATGALLDRRATRFGIREIRWEQTPGAPADYPNPLKLVVNGRPIRQMGSNLVPPDALFGRMNARGPRLLELAREAGINCLRLWGGGVILSEAIYDRADELGIMLLQEFPLANCLPETNTMFLANLETTARNIVKQVRNHPSIVEWAGGSELPWKNGDTHPALRLLEKVVREQDGRIFRSAEPAQGSGPHGTYTYVYHTEPAPYLSWLGAGKQNLYQRYDSSTEMRLSEFGTHSPANLEVWHRTIPPKSQWPLSDYADPVLIRKNVFWGAMLKENWLHKEITERLFGPLAGLEQLVPAGQFLGAEGLRYAMDALRRKGPALGGGFMSWDYNEPWLNGAGSYMVDYDGRPLLNYDFVTEALAPVSLSLKYPSLLYDPGKGISAQLFLVSDAPKTTRDLQWHWRARDCRGDSFAQGNGRTEAIEPQAVLALESLVLHPPAERALGPVFVELRLEDRQGRILVERMHIFGAAAVGFPLAGLLPSGLADRDDTDAKPQGLPRIGFTGGLAARPVARTTITIESQPVRVESAQEVLDLVVHNTGPMTALFCEPHPLIEYRTDLFIRNNHVSIPPGETRTLTIRSAARPAGGLSLAQTGWRVTAWNADERVIEPDATVLLALGRRDAMCREFSTHAAAGGAKVNLVGSRPDPSPVAWLFRGQDVVQFTFPLSGLRAKHPARLRIHAADQAEETPARVEARISGWRMQGTLAPGLGIQRTDPAHLAFPASLAFQIPANQLRPGENKLEVHLNGAGWFSWDALDLISLCPGDSTGAEGYK